MFWKIFTLQHILIVLFLVSGVLAAPFLDNEIEPTMYKEHKCGELALPLSVQCANHWWILPVDRILFLPGFMAILLWPVSALFAYVLHSKKKSEQK